MKEFIFTTTEEKILDGINKIKESGGNFVHNENKDEEGYIFYIKGIKGTFTHKKIKEDEFEVIINIENKPLLITWGIIEKTLHDFFTK